MKIDLKNIEKTASEIRNNYLRNELDSLETAVVFVNKLIRSDQTIVKKEPVIEKSIQVEPKHTEVSLPLQKSEVGLLKQTPTPKPIPIPPPNPHIHKYLNRTDSELDQLLESGKISLSTFMKVVDEKTVEELT